jgi:hypothetical protein
LEWAKSRSPYELRPLLESVEVWISADIKTHYTLDGTTVTKSKGGSGVKISTGEEGTAKVKIYVSANKHNRDTALITDFPEQLAAALKLEPAKLPDFYTVLQVPLSSLKAWLIRKGITGGNAADDYDETPETYSAGGNWQSQNEGSSDDSSYGGSGGNGGSDSDDNGDDALRIFANDVHTDSRGSVVVESAHASARSDTANTTQQPHVVYRIGSRPTTPELCSQRHLNVTADQAPHERPLTPHSTAAGLYSTDNRQQNRERLQRFARDADLVSTARRERSSDQYGVGESAFDMSTLRDTLAAAEPAHVATLVQIDRGPRRRAGPIPNRNEEEMARDFEVGFLGEQFVSPLDNLACRIYPGYKLTRRQVYTLLHDTIELPDFTGEGNWTSSLRTRAGFSAFGHEVSDFTYKDTEGTLTRHFLQMQHPYATPDWLSTICNDGNMPLYRLEVKSTTSQDPTTAFYMSGAQHKLVNSFCHCNNSAGSGLISKQAKRLHITSATPSEVYVIVRVSGLDALEEGAQHRPQWRAYLDPYARGEEGVLNFFAPTYAVTATA